MFLKITWRWRKLGWDEKGAHPKFVYVDPATEFICFFFYVGRVEVYIQLNNSLKGNDLYCWLRSSVKYFAIWTWLKIANWLLSYSCYFRESKSSNRLGRVKAVRDHFVLTVQLSHLSVCLFVVTMTVMMLLGHICLTTEDSTAQIIFILSRQVKRIFLFT